MKKIITTLWFFILLTPVYAQESGNMLGGMAVSICKAEALDTARVAVMDTYQLNTDEVNVELNNAIKRNDKLQNAVLSLCQEMTKTVEEAR